MQFTGFPVPPFGFHPPVNATSFKLTSPTTLTAVVPAGAVTGPMTVTNAGGASPPSAPVTIAPKATAIAPASGPVGTLVTITGTNFDETASATVGGVPLTEIQPVGFSGTQLRGKIGPGAVTGSAPGNTSVTTGGGTTVGPGPLFKVMPNVTGLDDDSYQAGDPVIASGTNLDEVTALKIGSVSVTPLAHDGGDLDFHVPTTAVTGPITVTSQSGTTVTKTILKVRPKLDPLATTHGFVGSTVMLTGSTLAGTTSVQFAGYNGSPVKAAFKLAAGALTVTVPSAAISGPITVTNAGGPESSGTYIVDPKITSVTPASSAVGTTVTLAGSGLSPLDQALFTGTADPVTSALAGSNANTLKLQVPDGAQSGTIEVHTLGSGVHPTIAFKVAPLITGFDDPVNINQHVTITGKNLGGLVANGLKLGSIVLTPQNAGPGSVEFDVPANAVTAKLSLTTAAGTATSLTPLHITPVVTGAPNPDNGPAGTSVTIPGTGLNDVSSVGFTSFTGGTVAATFSKVTGGIKATVPAAAVTGPISIHTPGGDTQTSSFLVLPNITSFTPTSGVAGSTVVTINGSGFQPHASVSFGSAQADDPVSISATQIKINVAPGATTGQTIRVSNPLPDGTSALSKSTFTVTSTLTSISTDSGQRGSTLTITGIGFASNAQVFFGGTATTIGSAGPATITHRTGSTELTVTVPNNASTGRIGVRNGTSSSSAFVTSADEYTVLTGPPVRDDNGLSSGPTGTPVTVALPGVPADATVTMAGKPVSNLVITPGSSVAFDVPDGSGGGNDVDVVVTEPGKPPMHSIAPFHIDFGIDDAGSVLTNHVGQSFLIRGGSYNTTEPVTVKIGDVEAVVIPDGKPSNAASISATVPDGVTAAKVSVTTAGEDRLQRQELRPAGRGHDRHQRERRPDRDAAHADRALAARRRRRHLRRAPGADRQRRRPGHRPPVAAHHDPGRRCPAASSNGHHYGTILVYDPAAPSQSSQASFEVTMGVTGFSPASGAAGDQVTISGLGFSAASKVAFAGAAPVSASFFNGDLTVHVPADAQDGKISVTSPINPQGDQATVSSAGTFDVTGVEQQFQARQLH